MTAAQTGLDGHALWRVPLALLSFLFNRACRFGLRALLVLGSSLSKRGFARWRVTSASTIATPLFVPLVMTSGPRWNTHAFTANVGPLHIGEALAIDTGILNRTASAWSLTGYTIPDFADRIFLSSHEARAQADRVSLAVRAGRYLLGVRLYEPADDAVMPALHIDERLAIAAQPVPPDANAFLAALAGREPRAFYLCLQYYVWVMLRYARRPFPAWVRREFLPVGNAGTHFDFDLVAPGTPLRVEVDERVIARYGVYLTVYDLRSFPIAWHRVRGPVACLPGLRGSAYFVLRCQAFGTDGAIEALPRVAAAAPEAGTSVEWDHRHD